MAELSASPIPTPSASTAFRIASKLSAERAEISHLSRTSFDTMQVPYAVPVSQRLPGTITVHASLSAKSAGQQADRDRLPAQEPGKKRRFNAEPAWFDTLTMSAHPEPVEG